MPSNTHPSSLGEGGSLFFDFAPSRRLKKGWEFDAVFRTGRQQRGELVRFYFMYAPQRTGQSARVGVAVGKRIANAVARARGRRLLRESFRRLLPWMKADLWVVASLREVALASDARAVYHDMAASLRRARMLRDDWPGVCWAVDSPASGSSPPR